jgi:hypothetical protein
VVPEAAINCLSNSISGMIFVLRVKRAFMVAYSTETQVLWGCLQTLHSAALNLVTAVAQICNASEAPRLRNAGPILTSGLLSFG